MVLCVALGLCSRLDSTDSIRGIVLPTLTSMDGGNAKGLLGTILAM
jgi:hypothetical protein